MLHFKNSTIAIYKKPNYYLLISANFRYQEIIQAWSIQNNIVHGRKFEKH